VPDVRWARSLLSFGADVEVLSPPEARRILAEAASSVTELYAENG